MNKFVLICLSLSTLPCLASASNNALIGEAYDTKTNQMVYQERHHYAQENGENVMYSMFVDPNGDTIGERKVAFTEDRVQSYHLDQNLINYQESVIRNNDSITLIGKKGNKVKQKEVANSPEVIIDAGFSNFIVRNWEELQKGKTLRFDFASIGQMDTVRLQVKQVDLARTSASDHGVNEDEVMMFHMTAANALIRLLLKPIEIGYYKDTRQLAYYKGVSNLKDQKGKQFSSVRIQYAKALPAKQG